MFRRTDGSVRATTGTEANTHSQRQTTAAWASTFFRYIAAVVATALALGGMALLRRIPGADAPFLLATVPVIFACWLGGLGPGLFAATIVTLGIDFFFVEPRYHFTIADYGQGLNLSVFLLESAGIVWLIEAVRAERRRAERHAQEAEDHERALIQSEMRFKQLADSGTIGVVSSDLAGTILDANDTFLQLIGYTRDELAAGQVRWDTITPAAQRDRDRLAMDELRAKGMCAPYEKTFVCRDGTLVPVLLGATWPNQFSQRIHAYVVDLTARQRAEELAAASARKLADTLQNLGDAFLIIDRQWRFTYVNREGERLLQRSNQELFGQDLWSALPTAARSKVQHEFHRAVEQRISVHFESYFEPLKVWHAVHAYPAEEGLAVYFHDITPLKQSEAALRESEQRLDLVVKSSELGLWSWDLPFGKLVCNEKCREHFGISADEPVTLDVLFQCLHPDDRERTREAIERAIRDGNPYDHDYRTFDPDGQMRWIRAFGRVLRDESGKPTRFDSITMDVSQRRAAEEALRRSEAQLRFAIAAAHMGDWSWDLQSGFVIRSASTQRLMGYEAGTMEPHIEWFHDRVHPADRPAVRAAMDRAIEARDVPYEIEFRIIRPDGIERWMHDRGEVFRDENGAPIQMVGIVVDVTDRKQVEVELQRAKDDAELANRMKDEFLATLSHELRTPLNAILGWSQILQASTGRGRPDREELTEGLDVIERNAKSQAQLIEDVLDVSRIISGKMRLDARPIDMVPVVNAAIAAVRPAAEAKEIRLYPILDPSAGPVFGDAGRLQQVVWNILSNAIKFTPRGGRVDIQLSRRTESKSGGEFDQNNEDTRQIAELVITDSGQGIKAEFLPHVFERFRQADASTTRKHAGLGLGLAIVRHLVEAHGGTVVATSPGEWQGSTFTVCLPIKSAVPSEDTPSGGAAPVRPENDDFPAETQPELSGLRVLVVDDDLDARMLVAKVLRDLSAEVTTAGSAAEALELLRSNSRAPDVLVSDIGMPDQDGYALIRSVRGMEQEVGRDSTAALPAIALTAFARADDRAKALSAGFQHFIPKPVEPTDLATAVATVVGRRREDRR
jgi:PAS domain S-box-containing protein